MTELIYALLLAFGIAVAWFLIDNATESLGAKSFWDAEDEYYDGPVKDRSQIYTDCDYKDTLGLRCSGVINGIMVQSSVCSDCMAWDREEWLKITDKIPSCSFKDAVTMGYEARGPLGLGPNTKLEPLPSPDDGGGLPHDRGECLHCGTWNDAPSSCASCGAPVPKTKFQLAWENSPRYVLKT